MILSVNPLGLLLLSTLLPVLANANAEPITTTACLPSEPGVEGCLTVRWHEQPFFTCYFNLTDTAYDGNGVYAYIEANFREDNEAERVASPVYRNDKGAGNTIEASWGYVSTPTQVLQSVALVACVGDGGGGEEDCVIKMEMGNPFLGVKWEGE